MYFLFLNVLVGNGVLNMSMVENVVGFGFGLYYLKIVYRCVGEDGLWNVFCVKNVYGKLRVINDCKVLDRVVFKLCKFFF